MLDAVGAVSVGVVVDYGCGIESGGGAAQRDEAVLEVVGAILVSDGAVGDYRVGGIYKYQDDFT